MSLDYEKMSPEERLSVQKQLMGALDMLIASDFLDFAEEQTGKSWDEVKKIFNTLVVKKEFRDNFTIGMYIHKSAIKFFK